MMSATFSSCKFENVERISFQLSGNFLNELTNFLVLHICCWRDLIINVSYVYSNTNIDVIGFES